MIDVAVADGVRLLTMSAEENRLNLPFVTRLDEAMAAASTEAGPLVLTGSGKYFCNGLDLDWMSGAKPGEAGAMMQLFYGVLARFLAFPGVTVAALNGHAFGAGAILAAAADVRIMRQERGYFCFPEVDLGLAMSDEFDAVLQAKYPRASLLEGLLSGARYGAEEAQALGFVDRVAPQDELLTAALDHARGLAGKDGGTVRALRMTLFRSALAVLEGS